MAGNATVGTAYIQILPTTKGIKAALQSQLNDEVGTSGQDSGKKFGDVFKRAIAGADIGGAVAKGISASVSEGAKLEQSMGGIKTLFKDSYGKMTQYAAQAFKSTGVSANTYMENVTSFSAALIKSLGGDTNKAADAANQAMVDMGDNANKMGTDMQSIQNAYQGFAKQNYTMLDNLKLGYGGTKSEMERLLKEAGELSGKKYDISSLSDVYEAIHVIQEDLDITGTTAKEAETTLSGSFNSMKAAAQDFMGNLAIGGDVQGSLTNLMTSIGTFVMGNLVPTIGRIVSAIPSVLATLLPQAVPALLQSITSLLHSTSEALSNVSGESMLPAIRNVMNKVGQAIIEYGPDLLAAIAELIAYAVQSMAGLLQDVAIVLAEWFASLAGQISPYASAVAQAALTPFDGLKSAMSAVFNAIKAVASTIWNGIKLVITTPINTAKTIILTAIKGIKTAFNVFKQVKSTVTSVFKAIKKAMTDPIKNAWEYIKNIPGKIKDAFKNLKISLPKPKLTPSISWVKFGKGKVSVSLPKISFNKYGGIFKKATLLGGNNVVGEAGAEAVLPLSTLWKQLDSAMSKQESGHVYNVTMTVNGADDPVAWANKFNRELRRQVRMA